MTDYQMCKSLTKPHCFNFLLIFVQSIQTLKVILSQWPVKVHRYRRTFLVHCLTVLTSSEMTISTHLWHGSLILAICLFTIVSKAISGVKRPVLCSERERERDPYLTKIYCNILQNTSVNIHPSATTVGTHLHLLIQTIIQSDIRHHVAALNALNHADTVLEFQLMFTS